MSLHLEMLQIARLAPKVLGEATGLVQTFLEGRQCPDGGFPDRDGRSDLYYTVFGIAGLLALQRPPPAERLAHYITRFGDGAGLDFVHLSCLARCLGLVAGTNPTAVSSTATRVLQRMEQYRTPDGGYHPVPGNRSGTAYGCFLAAGAYQDLRQSPPEAQGLVGCLASLETGDGGWANEVGVPAGATNATAAAVVVLRSIGGAARPGASEFLRSMAHPNGGFRAAPGAPIPDLLSTATALHTLALLEQPLRPFQEPCLDFIDTLWTNEGGFHGHWADDHLDCEYTYYGLLALGHLSL